MGRAGRAARAGACGLLAAAVLAGPAEARPVGEQADVLVARTPSATFDVTNGRYVLAGFNRFVEGPVGVTPPRAGSLFGGVELTDPVWDAQGNELFPDIVHNPDRGEYVAVTGDTSLRGVRWRTDGTYLGRFTIATQPPGSGGYRPAIAYDAARGEYAVVYSASIGGRDTVVARRIGRTGSNLATWTISDRPELVANLHPDVAHRPSAGDHVVVWQGVRADGTSEIYAQRLALGAGEVGPQDRQVSDHRNLAGRAENVSPAIAQRSDAAEGLVVFSDGYEVYGRRLSGPEAVPSARDERLSSMGPEGDPAYTAADPAVAHHPLAREYAVVWSGRDTGRPFPEVRVQHLTEAGSQIGPDDALVSFTSPEGWGESTNPTVAADPGTRGYLAAYDARYPIGEYIVGGRRLVAER